MAPAAAAEPEVTRLSKAISNTGTTTTTTTLTTLRQTTDLLSTSDCTYIYMYTLHTLILKVAFVCKDYILDEQLTK